MSNKPFPAMVETDGVHGLGCVQMLKPGNSPPALVSVDIPSGWHVEKGDESGSGADTLKLLQQGTHDHSSLHRGLQLGWAHASNDCVSTSLQWRLAPKDTPCQGDVYRCEVSCGTVPGLRPDMLVSLTAPKRAARCFEGPHHYLGGRFVPPAIKVCPARGCLCWQMVSLCRRRAVHVWHAQKPPRSVM